MRVFLGLLVNCLTLDSSFARTWYVLPDGMGDAPTITAALDSAVAGDDVLVAAGTYAWSSEGGSMTDVGPSMIVLASGVILHSESGPAVTILDAEGRGRVVYCERVSELTRLEGFTITGGVANGIPFVERSGGGIFCGTLGSPVIRDNIIQRRRHDDVHDVRPHRQHRGRSTRLHRHSVRGPGSVVAGFPVPAVQQ